MNTLFKSFLILGIVILIGLTSILAQDKTSSFKGKLFRSDTNAAIADARIILLDDKKTGTKDNSVEAKTNKDGKFLIPAVLGGKYTISIRVVYDREEDVPCQLLMGRLKGEKDSQLLVITEGTKKIYQVFIKGFSVKAGKQIEKDLDVSCVSMFG